MLRRATFDPEKGVGPFDESLFFEDRDMYLRLAASGGLFFHNALVAKYRISSTSLSRDHVHAEKMRSAMVQANRKALGYLSGSARSILLLAMFAEEARWERHPRLLWWPMGILTRLVLQALEVVHDLQVYWQNPPAQRMDADRPAHPSRH